jgi:hypothetical protein
MTADDLVAILDSEWVPVRARLGALAEDGFDRPLPGGTVRERAAEAVFWAETIPPVIADLRKQQMAPQDWYGGAPFQGWGDNAWHLEREARWARAHSKAELLARADRAQSRARACVATLTDDEIAADHELFGMYGGFRIERKIRECYGGMFGGLLADLDAAEVAGHR